MFYNILDKKRLDILPLFRKFKDSFYLAGGTSLTLQIGHRDSIDFDFFSEEDIHTTELFEQLRDIFKGHDLLKIQEEINTLTVLIENSVKVSFFTYKYKLIDKTISDENLTLASIGDVACMKLSAITVRASNKDYIDLYFILKFFSLSDLLDKSYRKHSQLDINLILKSLIYFEDVTQEKIIFKNNNNIDFEEVKKRLRSAVKEYSNINEK